MATTGKKSTTTRTRRNGHNKAKPVANNGNTAVLFEALGESTEALFGASRAASDRAHRLSQAAIADIQAAQRDVLRLAEAWAKSPLDLLGWYTQIVETAIHTQQRSAESARRLWAELSDAREETQTALQRSAQANWRAGRAAFSLVRDNLGR